MSECVLQLPLQRLPPLDQQVPLGAVVPGEAWWRRQTAWKRAWCARSLRRSSAGVDSVCAGAGRPRGWVGGRGPEQEVAPRLSVRAGGCSHQVWSDAARGASAVRPAAASRA